MRLRASGVVLLIVSASKIDAQCPNGSPPPCGPAPSAAAPVAPELARLTSAGNVTIARLSESGHLLAYSEGNVLYVRNLVAGGRPVEVLRGPRFQGSVEWFHDETRLLTVGDSGVFVVPALGGAADRLTERRRRATVSPDGRTVLLSSEVSSAQVVTLEPRSVRELTIQGNDVFYIEKAWSPDSRSFAMVSSDGRGRYRLQTVSVSSGVARVLLTDTVQLASPQWDAGSGAITYARAAGGSNVQQLWRQPVTTSGSAAGPPRLVTPLFQGYGLHVIESGAAIAFVRREATARVAVRSLGADTATRWISPPAAAFQARFDEDGSAIAVAYSDGTGMNLFVNRGNADSLTQLTFGRGVTIQEVRWSPSGKRLAFCGGTVDHPTLNLLYVGGGPPAVVAPSDLSNTCQFGWYSDSVLMYQVSGNRNVALVSLTNRAVGRVLRSDSVAWVFVPAVDYASGRIAVALTPTAGAKWIRIARLSDSISKRLPSLGYPLRFARDGASLFIKTPTGFLLRHGLGESPTLDTIRAPAGCGPVDITPDGSKLLCIVRLSAVSDAWVIRNFDAAAVRQGQVRP